MAGLAPGGARIARDYALYGAGLAGAADLARGGAGAGCRCGGAAQLWHGAGQCAVCGLASMAGR